MKQFAWQKIPPSASKSAKSCDNTPYCNQMVPLRQKNVALGSKLSSGLGDSGDDHRRCHPPHYPPLLLLRLRPTRTAVVGPSRLVPVGGALVQLPSGKFVGVQEKLAAAWWLRLASAAAVQCCRGSI